ncbi:hypothetical protein DLD82_02025 [Methanospirillum stamsii]|uniref:DUF1648 domain-containing protein n=2 Tax=Methanospirillum stamsii TaxID=1277351 RepID=A0A2V2NB92_9EURY|nr:hypothetical protein DLD82_02025 [Methanospirillum stamsii]
MSHMGISKKVYSWMGWCPNSSAIHTAIEIPSYLNIVEKGSPISGRGLLFFQLTWIVVGLSFLTALAFLPYLPEIVPVHWNIQGDADRFSDKLSGAFGLPAIILIMALFLNLLPRFEKMKENLEASGDFYQVIICSTISLLYGIEILVLLVSSGTMISLEVMIPILIGCFFAILGYIMPYIKRNTTVGFRFPWTLRDDRIWKQTHVHGGKIFMAAGLLVILIAPFAGIWGIFVLLLVVLLASLYVAVYSYRLSKIMDTRNGSPI